MSRVAGAGPTPDKAVDADFGAPAQPAARPRILCVDDEPAILAMLERALGSQYEVVTQADPQAALALVQHGRFAVVISDMKMPGMGGEAFLEQVKKLDPQTTRLALTGGLEWQLPPEIAFGIITKPVTLPLLRATVNAAVQCHALAAPSEPPAGPQPPLLSFSGLRTPQPANSSARAVAPDASKLVESGLRPRQLEAATQPEPAPAVVRTNPPPARGTAQFAVCLLGTRVELWPRATLLGRAMDCDIVVRDERVAARHLRFFSSWRGVTVQDVSGTGSTRLNGVRLDRVRFIQPGDCIDLGPFDIRIEAVDA
jgi:CheY-like chemotaxis protein